MEVYEFIRAIIQHVPDRQFKIIHYYEAYCRKWKKEYEFCISKVSIIQTQIKDYQSNQVCR